MAIHDMGLKQAINQSELLVSLETDHIETKSNRTHQTKLRVAVIDTRALFAEILHAALQAEDPSVHFAAHPSVADWIGTQHLTEEAIVLLSTDSLELDTSGDALVKQLTAFKSLDRPVHLILVSNSEDPEMILPLITSGASAYVSTNMTLRAVVQVIRLVEAGGVFVPFSVLQTSIGQGEREPKQSSRDDMLLSPRQILVAKALRRGTPNKVIAYDLNMCESTVKVHVRQIMKKLKARNRTQVAFLTNAMFDDGE